MERVAFLVEATGARVSCLLNPASLEVRRLAGLRPRTGISGPLTGRGRSDDPILATGGGHTELHMDLLFDVTLAPGAPDDVRALTGPLSALAENALALDGVPRVPQLRFVWGKAWNVPAVVAAASERLEEFSPGGAPRRSWLRLCLWRVSELARSPRASSTSEADRGAAEASGPAPAGTPERRVVVAAGDRLDEIAARHYGDPARWRQIARANDLADPLALVAGAVLVLPGVAP